MIFYFSSTGNNQHIANVIADTSDERVKSISECLREEQYRYEIKSGELLGVVVPTYFWGLPYPVCDFLDRLEIVASEKPYTFFVASYGTTNGIAGQQANEYLAGKGYAFNARFSVKMPDTWTPIFDLSDGEKVRRKLEHAEHEISTVCNKIMARENGDFMKMKMPLPLGTAYYNRAYPHYSRTKYFSVTDACIGCGLCARNCPASAITMSDGRPTWTSDTCVTCLGCLHNCPRFAIDYGKSTRKHGQYHHPRTPEG